MSDVKARAEARRQKILNRGTDRLAIAKGEKEPESLVDDRPLATRKALVSSCSTLHSAGESEVKLRQNLSAIDYSHSDDKEIVKGIVESIITESLALTKDRSIFTKPTILSNEKHATSSVNKSPSIPVKFPTDTVATDQVNKKSTPTSQIKCQDILNLLRLLVILFVSIAAGYWRFHRCSTFENYISREYYPENTITSSVVSSEFEEPTIQATIFSPLLTMSTSSPGSSRTWLAWIDQWLGGSICNPVLANSLVSIICRLLKPFFERKHAGVTVGAMSLVASAITLFQNGYSGLLDPIINYASEVILHILGMIVTICLLSQWKLHYTYLNNSTSNSELYTSSKSDL